MKYLKKFNESKTFEYPTDPDEITEIFLWMIGVGGRQSNDWVKERLEIEPDGTLNWKGNIEILYLKEQKWQVPIANRQRLPIKFGRVDGSFTISAVTNIKSLIGCPHTCDSFIISNLGISSLEGAPSKVYRNYNVRGNKLTSLEGAPQEIGGYFDCSWMSSLTTLEGAPKRVGSYFNCSHTSIRNLIGGPESVAEYKNTCYSVYRCEKLTSLEGLPKHCLHFIFDPIKNLWDPTPFKDKDIKIISDGPPSIPMGPLQCLMDIFYEKWGKGDTPDNEELKISTKLFIESLDYSYIRGDADEPKINLFRFVEVFKEFGYSPEKYRIIELMRFYTFVDDSGNPITNQDTIISTLTNIS